MPKAHSPILLRDIPPNFRCPHSISSIYLHPFPPSTQNHGKETSVPPSWMQNLHPTQSHLKLHTRSYSPLSHLIWSIHVSVCPSPHLSHSLSVFPRITVFNIQSHAWYPVQLGMSGSRWYTMCSFEKSFSVSNREQIYSEHWETTEAHLHTDEIIH